MGKLPVDFSLETFFEKLNKTAKIEEISTIPRRAFLKGSLGVGVSIPALLSLSSCGGGGKSSNRTMKSQCGGEYQNAFTAGGYIGSISGDARLATIALGIYTAPRAPGLPIQYSYVQVWSTNDARKVISYPAFVEGGMGKISMSQDGSRVLNVATDGVTLELRDASNGNLIRRFVGHTRRVWATTFSRDEKIIASSGSDQTVRVWNTETGELLLTCSPYMSSMNLMSIALNPSGNMVAAGEENGRAFVWSIPSGDLLFTYLGQMKNLTSTGAIVFSPNGTEIASSCGTLDIWDLRGNSRTVPTPPNLTWNSAASTIVSFLPDGSTIALAGSDHGQVEIDALTGTVTKELYGNSEVRVDDLAMSRDGSMIATVKNYSIQNDYQWTSRVSIWEMNGGGFLRALVDATLPAIPKGISKYCTRGESDGSDPLCSCDTVCVCDQVCTCDSEGGTFYCTCDTVCTCNIVYI